MSDGEPTPLDPDVEELLRAERDGGAPPSGARDRVRSRVLASVGLAAVGAATGSQAALGAAPKLLGSLGVKLLVGVAGVTAIGFGLHATLRARPHGPPAIERAASSRAPAVTRVANPPVANPPVANPPVANPLVENVASVPAPSAAPIREPARARALQRQTDEREDLPAERALLEEGRSALSRGDAARALAAVARHQRRFPRGQLVEERDSLTIRALVTAGRPDDARARAGEFRARFPRSIFLPVVDATVKSLP